jgi:ABC-type Mn2+/Zn2+ transport system ATPase subunit
VTLLVGNNNTGKSALVRALHVMQQGGELTGQEMRRGAVSGSIKIGLSDVTAGIFPSAPNNLGDVVLTANINGGRTVDVGRGALRVQPKSTTSSQ